MDPQKKDSLLNEAKAAERKMKKCLLSLRYHRATLDSLRQADKGEEFSKSIETEEKIILGVERIYKRNADRYVLINIMLGLSYN